MASNITTTTTDSAMSTFGVKVTLTGTPETTLVPLMAKALDAEHPNPILGDKWAKDVLEKLDHDITKYHVWDQQRVTYSQRARCFDAWTAEFLAEHPVATVVHLACGLDSRCFRVGWHGDAVRWVDIDLPSVVALRRRLLPCPGGKDYTLLGADVTDDTWLHTIPADRPTVIVFEGLSMYLDEMVGEQLIRRVLEHFTTGQILFDAIGSISVTMQGINKPIMATGATFTWGIDDPKVLERVFAPEYPKFRLRDCLRPPERDGFAEYPAVTRFILLVFSYLPWFCCVSSFLRFDF